MIKVVIADDHKLFAQGLATIISSSPKIEVVAVFNDGRSLIDYLCNQHADVAIVDLNMPYFDGYHTLKGLNNQGITIKKIVLTMYADEKVIKSCMTAGINAYLLKDAEPDVLIQTIIDVSEGRDQLVDVVNHSSSNDFKDDFLKKHSLSKRELEIAGLIATGLTNSKIAEKLFISSYTVDTHRKNLLNKLEVKNSAELVRLLAEQNLL